MLVKKLFSYSINNFFSLLLDKMDNSFSFEEFCGSEILVDEVNKTKNK